MLNRQREPQDTPNGANIPKTTMFNDASIFPTFPYTSSVNWQGIEIMTIYFFQIQFISIHRERFTGPRA